MYKSSICIQHFVYLQDFRKQLTLRNVKTELYVYIYSQINHFIEYI